MRIQKRARICLCISAAILAVALVMSLMGYGINYGIALVPEGMAGPMNSVEVIGFAVTNVVSEEEQLAAYRFIEWWNTEDAEGNSPALTWSLENGFPTQLPEEKEEEQHEVAQ